MKKATAERTADSKTRKVEVTDNKIVYTLKCDGAKDYMTYNETLYEILCMNSLKPFRDEGRLRIKARHNGVDQNFYLYDLAIACYSGQMHTESFLHDMQEFLNYKNRYDLVTDHIDGHTNNNTRFNLSLMTNTQNLNKGAIVARVPKPSLLGACYVDGVYRVHYERRGIEPDSILKLINGAIGGEHVLTAGGSTMTMARNHFCDNAESFLSCLRNLVGGEVRYQEEVLAPRLRTDKGWTEPKGESYLADVLKAIQFQEQLASRPQEEFDRWK